MNKGIREEDLLALFRELPKITDNRDFQTLHERVLEGLHRRKTIRRRLWPALAGGFAAIFAIILGISAFDGPYGQKAEPLSMGKDSAEIRENDGSFRDRARKEEEVTIKNSYVPLTSVYADMIGENQLAVTLVVPDREGQNMIPVTVLRDRNGDGDWIRPYTEMMGEIDEEKLGLSDYYPYHGSLRFKDNGGLVLDLEKNHPYGKGSASETNFLKSLESFRYMGVDRIYLYENGEPGIYLSHYGGPIYEYDVSDDPKTGSGYFLYETEGHSYFAPGPDVWEDLGKALNQMKEEIETHHLQPTISNQVDFTLNEETKPLLRVTFHAVEEKLSYETVVQMVEAILLTAKDFGYRQVLFENLGSISEGNFQPEGPMDVPLSPNLVETS